MLFNWFVAIISQCICVSKHQVVRFKRIQLGEFPGGLVVRIWHFHCRGWGSIPGRGTEIPQAARYSPKKCIQFLLKEKKIFLNAPSLDHLNDIVERSRAVTIHWPYSFSPCLPTSMATALIWPPSLLT